VASVTIKNGRPTPYSTVIEQSTYDSALQHIVRRINFDKSTGQLNSYRHYFYQGENLKATETYGSDDLLQQLAVYSYERNNNKKTVDYYSAQSEAHGLLLKQKCVFRSKNSRVTKKICQNVSNGQRTVINYEYEDGQLITKETKKNKPKNNQDSVQHQTITFAYTNDSKISSKTIRSTLWDGSIVTESHLLAYIQEKRMVEVKVYANDSVLSQRILKYYNHENELTTVLTVLPDGQYINQLNYTTRYKRIVLGTIKRKYFLEEQD
jgi:hypothetical protein